MRARRQTGQAELRAYVLHPGTAGIQPPKEIEDLRTKVVRRLPPPPIEPETPIAPRELKAQLSVAKPLAMTAADRDRLRELNAALPRLRRDAVLQTAAEDCSGHQAIGTVVPGTPLQPTDTVGTWVSMPIFDHGIDGFSGFLFTTFSNIAAQTFEFLGAYSTGNKAELSVFDWSCVDGKQGIPPGDPDNAWVYVKNQSELSSQYKFSYWDGCGWRKALALANKSRAVLVETPLRSLFGLAANMSLYVNEAKILNWNTLTWDTYYARLFLDRDAQPPRPWGPTAFVEFISDAGCPVVPRLGFREVRFRPPNGAWELAQPANSSLRFDLPATYRYGLLDPNHTWCIAKT